MAAPPAPPGPPPYYPYYAPPPPKNDSKLAIVIVVIVLVVVIVPIVVAAFLFVLVGGLLEGPTLPGPREARPAVTFAGAEPIANGFEFQCAGVSLSRPASSYQVILLVNETSSAATVLESSMTFVVGSHSYAINYQDLGGEGDLTGGDRFQVTLPGGLLAGTTYTVRVLWVDGVDVGGITFQEPGEAIPQLTFGGEQPIANGVEFRCTGASLARPATSYRVNLFVDGNPSSAKGLAPSMTFAVGGHSYTITYQDSTSDGSLNAGDRFQVTRPGGLLASAAFIVSVLWVDGSEVGRRPFQGPEPRPLLTFGGKQPILHGFEFQCAGASLTRPASNYRVDLLVNGTASTSGPKVLASSMSFTVSGGTYTIAYADVGGDGDLTGGDSFTLTRGGGISSASEFTVVFLWIDGVQVGSLTYP